MKYKAKLKFENGQEVEAVVTTAGNDYEDVLHYILNADEIDLATVRYGDITSIQIDQLTDTTEEDEANYILQPGSKSNWWTATDITHGIVMQWENGKLNDTQKVTALNDGYTALELARYARELIFYHYDKLY